MILTCPGCGFARESRPTTNSTCRKCSPRTSDGYGPAVIDDVMRNLIRESVTALRASALAGVAA